MWEGVEAIARVVTKTKRSAIGRGAYYLSQLHNRNGIAIVELNVPR